MSLQRINKAAVGPGFNPLPIIVISAAVVCVVAAMYFLSSETPTAFIIAVDQNSTNQSQQVNQTPVTETPKKKPNLVVSDLVLGNDFTFGEPTEIVAKVRNNGPGNSEATKLKIYANGKEVAELGVEALSPGGETQKSVIWNPAPLAGDFVIKAIVDPAYEVYETDDLDNEREMTIKQEKVSFGGELREHRPAFNTAWFSNMYQATQPAIDYFTLTKNNSLVYLDIGFAGFTALETNHIASIEMPIQKKTNLATTCLKPTMSDKECVWNGPSFKFDIKVEKGNLIVNDQYNNRKKIYVGEKYNVKSIKLDGAKQFSVPRGLRMFKPARAPSPDYFVPRSFYEVSGRELRFYPILWNPATNETVAYLRARFVIEVG